MGIGERVQKAEDHPIRGAILDALDGKELTTRELLPVVPGLPSPPDSAALGRVGYHVAVLEHAGLVERVGGVWRLP